MEGAGIFEITTHTRTISMNPCRLKFRK